MCIDYALHPLQGMNSEEAKLEISTSADRDRVAISFIHNGEMLPPKQLHSQLALFYGSKARKTGLELPTARYLARRYGGTVSIETLPDDRTTVRVQLPVGPGPHDDRR